MPSSTGSEPQFPPIVVDQPQLTLRALATGMVLGAILAPCNIYAGLKIGWSFNMSVAAALLSYGFWQGLHRAGVGRPWGMLENNINQTGASAGAAIASAGLVAPIPALTMLTGFQLPYTELIIWVFCVSFVGVVVAIGIRRQMLEVDTLTFPAGVATAETLVEIYGEGKEAAARVKALIGAGVFSAGLKLFADYVVALPRLGLGALGFAASGAAQAAGVARITARNLGFVFDISPLMIGFGAIIGLRAGASLLVGAIVAWGVVAPIALDQGWAHPGVAQPTADWFGSLVEWLLWPGVSMMVAASLTSFAFSWRSVIAAFSGSKTGAVAIDPERAKHDVPKRVFLSLLLVALVAATAAQVGFFGIGVGVAVFGVIVTFLLAVVAGRVSGETGITPIGAMGKVTQLMFGVVSPGNPAANLMAANVTGGAAGQCADMLHDLKTGLLIGAKPRAQTTAQIAGIVAGSLSGTAAYLALIRDPATELVTEKWPAPAVATWKAVAEVFMKGADAMPEGAFAAIIVAATVGVVMAIGEKTLAPALARWIPSPASVGLAFVIPAYTSISIFTGAVIGAICMRYARSWAERFVIVIAAGLVAGHSLAGVAAAIQGVLASGG